MMILTVAIKASISDDSGTETMELGKFVLDYGKDSSEFIPNREGLSIDYSAEGAEFIFEYLEGQTHQMAEMLKEKLSDDDSRSFYEVMSLGNSEKDKRPHLENHFHEEWK